MAGGKICLIQLVSEEAVQNLLPVLALRPASVVHVRTSKTKERSNWIIEAARQSGVEAFKKDLDLEEMPGIKNTYDAVACAIDEALGLEQTPVVNFTGGTKLMSIGAYQAAAARKVDSIYVDTEHLHFTDGGTSSNLPRLVNGDFSFSPIGRMLNVDSISYANGSERVTPGKDWRKYAETAAFMLQHQDDERRCWQAVNKDLFQNGAEPKEPEKWKSLKDRNLNIPQECAVLAAEAGLLERNNMGFALPSKLIDELNHNPRAVESLKFITSFFSGAWWEVAVAKAASESGLFRDLRWSVNIGAKYSGPGREEDIVAVQGVQAVYVSCKRGGAKSRLLGQLDELDNRGRTIGGRFVRKFLAVYLPLNDRTGADVRKRARELNVKIIQPLKGKIPEQSFS